VHVLTVTLVLSLAADKGAGAVQPHGLAEAWRRLPALGNACGDELAYDYGVEGGMRNFYCRALQVLPWRQLLTLAPVAPFRSGPHRGGELDFTARSDFGHYDPDFVRWATVALVPAASDPALRRQTQPVYDAQVRGLARIHYRVWRALFSDRRVLVRERNAYLEAVRRGQADDQASRYETLLGPPERDFGGADPNLVRSAATWWLRRSADETASLWLQGLERLLSTYDAAWLAGSRTAKPSQAPGSKPDRGEALEPGLE
jgi:hypothetical protein